MYFSCQGLFAWRRTHSFVQGRARIRIYSAGRPSETLAIHCIFSIFSAEISAVTNRIGLAASFLVPNRKGINYQDLFLVGVASSTLIAPHQH